MPIDTDALKLFRDKWQSVQERLIERIDSGYGIYDGRTFKADRWARWLAANDIPWPRLPTGALALDDDTFKEMARAYPAVAPVRELRTTLAQLRLNELTVGSDGRNRCMLSAFGSRTSRNQPSNSRFIFGPSAWLRSLVRPEPGMAVAYLDWSQQEIAIAAALSGDRKMQDAYQSSDFYLSFAKMAGAVPPDATKDSHAAVREQFKAVALGVSYGMSAEGLARKLNVPPVRGRDLLRMHKETFRQFWRWSDAVQDEAILAGRLRTVFGWTVHTGDQPNPRSMRNFPMQGNGAEMMRLACCLATERGIGLCCPVHDALLIEADAEEIDVAVEATQQAMREASEVVLDGFQLRTDAKIVRHPDRYSDKRGQVMWETVCELCGRSP
ncbi:MAG: DNA polymerase I [Gemmataceae bacterium]